MNAAVEVMAENEKHDEFEDIPFTPRERKAIREMLEADKRARWFWKTIRTWVIAAGAVAVGFTAVWEGLKNAVKFLAK